VDALPTIDEVVVADPPDAWAAAGFDVDDDGVVRAGTVRVRLVGPDHGKRILSWSLRGVDVPAEGAIDGLTTCASESEPCAPADHPNGVVLIDHLVVASPNLSRTVEALEAVGLAARRTRESNTYGAPMRQVFFRLGEVVLEVIGGGEPAPLPIGDQPAGFFGLAYTVRDLDATKAFFGEHLGNVKDAVQPGRRIATLRHKELRMTVATAFMSAGDQEYS
jgi:hypothetical protein